MTTVAVTETRQVEIRRVLEEVFGLARDFLHRVEDLLTRSEYDEVYREIGILGAECTDAQLKLIRGRLIPMPVFEISPDEDPLV